MGLRFKLSPQCFNVYSRTLVSYGIIKLVASLNHVHSFKIEKAAKRRAFLVFNEIFIN